MPWTSVIEARAEACAVSADACTAVVAVPAVTASAVTRPSRTKVRFARDCFMVGSLRVGAPGDGAVSRRI